MLSLQSCLITSGLRKNNTDYSDYRHEFIQFSEHLKIFSGSYNAENKINGNTYKTYSFDSVLQGKNRILHIEIPDDYSLHPKVSETNENKVDNEIAYLAIRRYMVFGRDEFSDQLSDPVSKLPPPFDVIPIAPEKLAKAKEQDSVTLILIDFTNIYNRTIQEITWKRTENGEYKNERRFFFQDISNWKQTDKLHWRVRKHWVLALRKTALIFTGIIDIITYPLQLIVLKGIVK